MSAVALMLVNAPVVLLTRCTTAPVLSSMSAHVTADKACDCAAGSAQWLLSLAMSGL